MRLCRMKDSMRTGWVIGGHRQIARAKKYTNWPSDQLKNMTNAVTIPLGPDGLPEVVKIQVNIDPKSSIFDISAYRLESGIHAELP